MAASRRLSMNSCQNIKSKARKFNRLTSHKRDNGGSANGYVVWSDDSTTKANLQTLDQIETKFQNKTIALYAHSITRGGQASRVTVVPSPTPIYWSPISLHQRTQSLIASRWALGCLLATSWTQRQAAKFWAWSALPLRFCPPANHKMWFPWLPKWRVPVILYIFARTQRRVLQLAHI